MGNVRCLLFVLSQEWSVAVDDGCNNNGARALGVCARHLMNSWAHYQVVVGYVFYGPWRQSWGGCLFVRALLVSAVRLKRSRAFCVFLLPLHGRLWR